MKIVIHFLNKFRFEIPAEMCRLAAVAINASLLTTAVIYSREEKVRHGSRPTGLETKVSAIKKS